MKESPEKLKALQQRAKFLDGLERELTLEEEAVVKLAGVIEHLIGYAGDPGTQVMEIAVEVGEYLPEDWDAETE